MAFFGTKSHHHQQAAAGNGPGAQGPGAQLTLARERWGMSREQVASTLRLPDRVIAALEQDHYEDLPPPAFVRGYISGYARLVGLNAPELIAACEMRGCGDPALAAKRSLSLRKGRGETLLRWGSYAVLAAFLGSAMLYWTGNKDSGTAPLAIPGVPAEAPARGADTLPGTAVSPAPLAVRGNTAAGHTDITAAPPAYGSPAAMGANAAATPALISAPIHQRANPGNSAKAGTAAKLPAAEWPTLELKFSADSWLAVRDADGKRLAWETVKAGSTRQLQGQPPLKVVLGNAEAVRISFQGEPFDPTPFTIGRMARFSVE